MTITIVLLVALLFLVIIVSGFRFIYSLASNTNKQNTMHIDIKTKALDVFVYLGIAISLVVTVTNSIQVLFLAIERRFVDVLSATNYYVDSSQSDARFAIASLVVMFPIYIGLSWYTSRMISKALYKQDLPVRKILIYCTLFIAVLTLIGTLVSVIYTYLGGELSVRFAYKAGTVFIIALSLFSYYYYTLRRDYSKKTLVPMFMVGIASFVVILSVAWSISVIGTPATMRAKKIDSIRLSDISRIQQEILNRFNMTDKIPVDLSELNNAFQGYAVPSDPVTKVAYGYKVVQQPVLKMNYATNKKELVTPAIFELCATFEIERAVNERGQDISVSSAPTKFGMGGDSMYSAMNYYYEGDQSSFWNHGVGEACFKRIISSEMYYGK
jgi:hypothetical protein